MVKIVVARRYFGILRRNFLHLTIEHVAECCGLSPSTVRNAELSHKVQRSTIEKLMDFYVEALQERINLHREIHKIVQSRSK